MSPHTPYRAALVHLIAISRPSPVSFARSESRCTLAQRLEAAGAGAPVADWRDYDTFYTERYMRTPSANARGYDAASALTHAGKLSRPLMLVHGTSDDNVYFLHSMKLSEALFRAGKPFEFLPLAGFTHRVADPVVTQRLYGRMLEFFDTHVRDREPAGDAVRRPSSTRF